MQCRPGESNRTWDLKNGLREVRVCNVDCIGCIIDQDGAVLPRKGHQLFQLLPGGRGSCGIVGVAEEDQVCGLHLHSSRPSFNLPCCSAFPAALPSPLG